MTGENKLNVGLYRDESVKNRDGSATGVSENIFDPEIVEGLDECLGTV